MSMDHTFNRLNSPRLLIRRFRKSDVIPFAAYRNLEAVARYQGWARPFTQEQAETFIEEMDTVHPDSAGNWYQFALEVSETGEMIGDIGIHPDGENRENVEIGFSLHPTHQGKGYMSEGLRAVLDYLFDTRGKKRVEAFVDTRNHSCRHLLERLGFVLEKTLPAEAGVDAEHLFGLTHWPPT